ncbi:MAG: MmgE/PrpD family protein [Rhodococcus sp. (in: high G+C Gram-positive bacteria)]
MIALSSLLPTAPDGPTGILAAWIADLRLDQVPDAVQIRAKHLLLDGFACGLIGAQLPWSVRAVDAVRSFEGEGSSPLIGWGLTTSGPAACVLNGTFIQGFELDDYHPRAPLHSNSLLIPSIIATAHSRGLTSGEQFLTAAIAGFEVGPRVGLALHGGEMLSRGWHSGSVFGTHASAASAGWLRGLNPSQMEDALGLAATQSGGLMAAQYEAMSKRMHHGFASRNGFYAAGLAAAGYTGIKRVYEREYGGFLSTFGEGHDPDASQVSAGLGEKWETAEIAVKAYAAMAATHAPIDCMLNLRADGLRSDNVESIEVWVSHAAYHHGWWIPTRPIETIGAQMNIGYAMAVALLDGEVLTAQFTRKRIDAQDVWDLLARTEVHHDESFDDPAGLSRMSARLVVRTRDGSRREREVDGPTGGSGRPLSNEQIRAKCGALLRDVIDPATWSRIESLVLGLDELDDVSELITAVCEPVGPPNITL